MDDSHHLAGEMLDRVDAKLHDLVGGFRHPCGELPAVMEKDVVIGPAKPGSRIMHRLDLRNLECDGDIPLGINLIASSGVNAPFCSVVAIFGAASCCGTSGAPAPLIGSCVAANGAPFSGTAPPPRF